MKQTIFSIKSINLEQQRLLLANTDDAQGARIKKFISDCSQFKCILQLESKLSMRPDRQFPELSTSEKLTIIRRAHHHFEQLLELIIPDEDKRKQLCGNSNIFEPGYDQFGGYLIQRYRRISSDPNLEYAVCFIAVEVHQSLRFIGLGGNQAFRVHLEHDESIFNTISPNRLSEDLNEILKFFTENLPELRRL